jgi:tRNA 2-thiouridine synthesizing protein B
LTVYLIDEPFADVGLSYASDDPNASVVLVQDAVYLARGDLEGKVYVLSDDITRRGLAHSISSAVHVIDYPTLVDMMAKERVLCFL